MLRRWLHRARLLYDYDYYDYMNLFIYLSIAPYGYIV